jgi:hypothetical protein
MNSERRRGRAHGEVVAARSALHADSGRDRHRLTGRIPSPFAACAWLSLAAALVAAAARAIEPFEHGIWLVAYLFLVGFLAQALLGRGQADALAASPSGASTPPIRAQVAFWNAGVVAVPLGVMVGTRALVVLGSIALLIALNVFWQASRARHSQSRTASGSWGNAYTTLILVMAASVLVGTGLAWDIPWL